MVQLLILTMCALVHMDFSIVPRPPPTRGNGLVNLLYYYRYATNVLTLNNHWWKNIFVAKMSHDWPNASSLIECSISFPRPKKVFQIHQTLSKDKIQKHNTKPNITTHNLPTKFINYKRVALLGVSTVIKMGQIVQRNPLKHCNTTWSFKLVRTLKQSKEHVTSTQLATLQVEIRYCCNRTWIHSITS